MEIANNSDPLSDENENRCRVCLSTNDDNTCIFASRMTFDCKHDSLPKLSDKLQLYGGIKVGHNDGFPNKICNNCLSRMLVAHDFRTQCQETDKKLRSLHKNITNDGDMKKENLEQIIETYESNEPERLIAKPPLSGPWGISSNFNLSNSSEFAKFTNLVKSKENDAITKKVGHPCSRLMIIQKSSFDQLCEPHEIITQKSISPPNNESSESILENFENAKSKVSQLSNENSSSTSESLRTRRLIVFKRVTSMENLKNQKLRQRQYMRRTNFPKEERDDRENGQNINKNRHAPAQEVSENLIILPYKCTECCRSFSTERSMQEHQQSHEYKKFSCDQCDERFVKLAEFLRHAKSHELNDKLRPVNCPICNKNFRKFLPMVRHLHVHKRENPRAVYTILKDIRDKRRCKISIDNIANYDDTSKIGLGDREEHFIVQENVEKSVKIELRGDTRFVEESSISEIPNDDRSAIKLINMWIKEELDHDIEGKGFPCENCSKSYMTKKSLIKHMTKMHENCEFCIGNCNCPERNHENDDSDEKSKSHTCTECEKTFDDATKLEKHTRIHERERDNDDKNFKRFLCHICSKTFRQNTGLMFHMRTHTGYKPHVCKYCGRGFTSNSNCTNHERTHTGDRPFVCHYCSAAFAKSCTLKAHITTHTGEANYHCKTCGKSFRRLKYLKEHKFTHTGEKPYACKTCGTAYSHSGSLFVHEKKCKAQRDDCQDIEDHCAKEISLGGNNLKINLPNFNGREHKNLIDGIQRINGNTIIDNVESNSSNLTDVVSNQQNFTIIEESFHT